MTKAKVHESEFLEAMAITKSPFEHICGALNLIAEDGVDDLGAYKWAEAEVIGQKYALRTYEELPEPSTEFMLPRAKAKRVLLALMDRVGEKAEDLFWRHPMAGGELRRHIVDVLKEALTAERPLMQVLVGPRQVGKTTAVKHLCNEWPGPSHYVNADALVDRSEVAWLKGQWHDAKTMGEGTLLVIDEVQKIHDWSSRVKELWDETQPSGLRVVLLGSNSMRGLLGNKESLVGRYSAHFMPHWSFAETKEAFGLTIEQYAIFGGYPRASELAENLKEWLRFVGESIINPIIDSDILQEGRFRDFRALRKAFSVFCEASTPTSYTKLNERIHDTGNTESVKSYIEAFEKVFLLEGILRTSPKNSKAQRPTPKILAHCPAIYSFGKRSFDSLNEDPFRLEQVIGMELFRIPKVHLGYWKEGRASIDYFLRTADGQNYGVVVQTDRMSPEAERGVEEFPKRVDGGKVSFVNAGNFERFAWNPAEFLRKYSV